MRSDDFVAIQQLQALYVHIIDKKYWDRMGEIYAEDGVFDGSASDFGVHTGPANIAKQLAERARSVHHTSNVFVESSPEDESRAVGYAKFLMVGQDGAVRSGEYDDEYVRTPAGWRFQRRTSRVLAPSGWVHPSSQAAEGESAT